MPRANLGGRRTAVESRVRRRRRRATGEPPVAEVIENPISRYVRNIPVEDPFRYGEYTHVSDLVYKCMRMVALAGDLHIPVPTEANWQSMKLIHAMGHASAKYIENIVLNQTDKIFGYWRCVCGAHRIGPCKKSDLIPDPCGECNQSPSIYDEMTFTNEEYGLIGNCDLAIMEEGDFLLLTELKSISKKQFDDLSDAKPDHKLQLLMYYWMAVQAGYRVHPSLSVFYSCREWMIGNPFKEFMLPADTAERRVEPMLREATAIKEWRDNDGPIPERTWCNRPEDTRAKNCGMCAECFTRGN